MCAIARNVVCVFRFASWSGSRCETTKFIRARCVHRHRLSYAHRRTFIRVKSAALAVYCASLCGRISAHSTHWSVLVMSFDTYFLQNMSLYWSFTANSSYNYGGLTMNWPKIKCSLACMRYSEHIIDVHLEKYNRQGPARCQRLKWAKPSSSSSSD